MNNEILAFIFKQAATTRLPGKEPEQSLIEQVLPAINQYLRENVGIEVPQNQATGADIKLAHIFIEFKKPQSIRFGKKNSLIIKQAQSYLHSIKYALPTKGVLTDGTYFIFLERRNNQDIISEPIFIDSQSCSKFLSILDELKLSIYWESKLDEFCNYLKLRKSDNTRVSYRIDLRQFISFCIANEINIQDIPPLKIESFFANLPGKQRFSLANHTTLNRKSSAISMFFRYLKKAGIISNNPMENVERFSTRKGLPKFLTPEDIKILRDICPINILPILEFMLATGARATEACELNWINVHLDEKYVYIVYSKGGKTRKVPITDKVSHILRNLPSNDGKGNKVFTFNDGDFDLHYQQLYYQVKKLGLKIGRPITPHLLRHTAATYMAKGGMNIADIREILGHESLNTTGIYVHGVGRYRNEYENAMKDIE